MKSKKQKEAHPLAGQTMFICKCKNKYTLAQARIIGQSIFCPVCMEEFVFPTKMRDTRGNLATA